MYEHPDQTWKEQPNFLETGMIQLLASRLREYVSDHQLKQLLVIAHGGEPLLLGAKRLKEFFSIIKKSLQETETEVGFGLQTNGILVDDDIIKVLQEFDVQAGVSIDGPLEWHDQMRLDHKQVMKGVEKLRNPSNGNSVFGGFLTVANPEIPAQELFSFFENLNTTSMDFLLPDYNFDTFPYDRYPVGTFGRWFSELFDCWLDSKTDMEIRTFGKMMKLLMGGKRGYDAIGAFSHGVVVIETDGNSPEIFSPWKNRNRPLRQVIHALMTFSAGAVVWTKLIISPWFSSEKIGSQAENYWSETVEFADLAYQGLFNSEVLTDEGKTLISACVEQLKSAVKIGRESLC